MGKRKSRMSDVAILAPVDLSDATFDKKSNTFRKQILRKGEIDYKGRKIKFDDSFLMELAENFKKGAYDQVPFQFANDRNEHNEDPRNYSGEMVGVELTADGLDGVFKLTKAGRKAVKENPRLGVSARIMGAVRHSDGRAFGRSIRHVLATMNPRVTGMKPWEAVAADLSEEGTIEVVDLTAAKYKKGSTMAKKGKSKAKGQETQPRTATISLSVDGQDRQIDLSDLTDEEFQSLLDLASDDVADGTVIDFTDEIDERETKSLSKKVPAFLGKKSKATDTKDGKETLVKGKGKKAGEKVKGKAPAKKAKSSKSDKALASLSHRVAEGEWKRERRRMVRAGIPPALVDLAEPILSQPDDVVLDLSNDDGEAINATEVIRSMLDATEGFIEIKPELGHQVDLSQDDEGDTKDDSAEAFNKAWDEEFGKA